MVDNRLKQSFYIILIFNIFYKAFSDDANSLSPSTTRSTFKCATDGLFEDENDCQMYYECLWIGTAFEKQEHLRCPQQLIYNPRKHRCDNIYEFETQFANGIQTGEELIEFMRFRNCISTRNLITSTQDPNKTRVRSYIDNEDPYYSMLTANTSPPTEYWPQLYLLDESSVAKSDVHTTTIATTTTSTHSIQKMDNNETNEYGKSFSHTQPTKHNEAAPSQPVVARINSKLNHVFTLSNNTSKKSKFYLEKMLDQFESGPKSTKRPQLVNEVMGSKRNSSIIGGIKNNGSYIIFGAGSATSKPVEAAIFKKIPGLKKRHRKQNPTFLSRRLLSFNDIEPSDSSTTSEEMDSPTTILDDEEIESTDASYHDKEAAIHEFTNKILNDFKHSQIKETPQSNSTTTTTPTTTTQANTTTTHVSETTNRADLIDSIEQRLTKRGEQTKTEKKIIDNDSNTVVILKGPDNNSSNQAELMTTTPSFKLTVSSRALKFLKMLPPVNLSTLDLEKKQLKLDKLNDMFEKKLNLNPDAEPNSSLETDEPTTLSSSQQPRGQRTHRKFTTKPPSATTPYTLVTKSWSTPRGVNVSRVLSSTLSWTSGIAESTPTVGPGFVPSKTNSKPFMQTYKINEKKRLPNQFASLRLNYGAVAGKGQVEEVVDQISTSPYSETTTQNPFTKIDELERGGKFQRLRLVPADTLIECKENDFGLECSCSITLSPPKCKQLINSFLSSCRILGCKNNGKCINMAYKYPIPYVCSCPSAFMGSYCEINRVSGVSTETVDTPVLRPKLEAGVRSASAFSSSYKLYPTQGVNSSKKLASTSTVLPLLNSTTTRGFEAKSSSATFNLSLATFNKLSTPVPKPRKSFTTTDFEFKEPLCQPNPCQNDAKCMVINDKIKCLCLNSSYTGKYCETTDIKPTMVTKPTTTTTSTTTTDSTTQNVRSTTRPKSPKYGTSPKIPPVFEANHQTTTRAYFWQCPSNCFYSSGHGFCALSQSGYPHCVCHIGWTGIDCSQKNYCADNECSQNSTCANYPEKNTYICLCPPGYSGRLCEARLERPENRRKQFSDPNKSSINKSFYRLVSAGGSLKADPAGNNPTSQLQSSILPPKNPCLTEKCKNNGTCVMSFSHAKNSFSFVCKCPAGFYGPLCENSTTSTATGLPFDDRDKSKMPVKETQWLKQNNRRIKQGFKTGPNSMLESSNPCTNDMDLCRKHPHGNASFICVKSFITQDYTLCLPTKSMNCKESNPCLNGGICVEEENDESEGAANNRPPWRCICSVEYTGRLCETEICSPVHKLFPNHTMCMPNSDKFVTGGLSPSDVDLILDMHNTLRRQVAPIASNMQKMYWDIRLQYLAQKRAQLCSVENTGILMRQQPGYGIVIGENLAAGYEKWSHVLTSWMSERKFFIYKSSSPADNLQAGHYTQMIYSSASRIGCGFSQCTNTTYDRYFVCYYGEMQTYYSRYEPYQDGKTCASCENNCDNGLCDCKGAYCLNGGTMDLRTCTCSCPYSTFSGRYCENVICPSQDSPFCSQTLFEDKCWLYPVVRATCPYMCSLCTRYNENTNASVSINSLNENFRY